ncbi:MAG TPA: hypothetical protein PK323_07760 [Bacteroidia bacterium]|nr:hypothetical protein [Bacteroidia bacterium]
MKHFKLRIRYFLCLFFLLTKVLQAQDDTLNVFRNDSQKPKKAKEETNNIGGSNAFSITLNGIARGGFTICYERYIEEFNFYEYSLSNVAYFAGIGISIMDVTGQYDLANKKYFFNNSYSNLVSNDPSRYFEMGLKYYLNEELDGTYFALSGAEVKNTQTRNLKQGYFFENTSSSDYQYTYDSFEFKLLFGSVNGFGKRFYNDFSLGMGFRSIDYQQLNKAEVNSSSTTQIPGKTMLVLEDMNNKQFWLFLGWKVGIRF